MDNYFSIVFAVIGIVFLLWGFIQTKKRKGIDKALMYILMILISFSFGSLVGSLWK